MIDIFLPDQHTLDVQSYEELRTNPLIKSINIMNHRMRGMSNSDFIDDVYQKLSVCPLAKANELADKKEHSHYIMLLLKPYKLRLGHHAIERLQQVAEDSNAAMVYTDHYEIMHGERIRIPKIDYQFGSLRDDFNFGPMVLVRTDLFLKVVDGLRANKEKYNAAVFYRLRLKLSQLGEIVHLNEYIYEVEEDETRSNEEKMFDYVNPRNRDVQIEMEEACTKHLKEIGAYLPEREEKINIAEACNYPFEASIIIPVRNRVATIRAAVQSALSQCANFDFNVIVVDNHSDDGTSELLDKLCRADNRLIVIRPERTDLGIGGCWNLAIEDKRCGKFSVQLDSDDMYSSSNTLQTIVDAFHEQKTAMIIGSYQLTDIDCNPIPPGIINHKEWTPTNGHNNALRVNGLGAPRAFFTPILRKLLLPNTSYGEDYAIGLRISRNHLIGRIYDVLYNCRRWSGNSDSNIDIQKLNANNHYKDLIRTLELKARIQMNNSAIKK